MVVESALAQGERFFVSPNEGAQDGFVRSEAAYPVMEAGRGSGKTGGAVLKGFGYQFANPGAVGMMTEPTYKQIDRVLMPVIREIWGPLEGRSWSFLKGDYRLDFAAGGNILLGAAEDPERFVGMSLAWACMDEVSETKGGSQEPAYLNMVGSIRQRGYRNWLGLTGTPRGYNWLTRTVYDEDERARPGFEVFKGDARENEKHLAKGYWQSLKDRYGEGTPLYRQMALGEIVRLEGLVLSMFDRSRHVSPEPQGAVWVKRMAGLDFGVHSPTAIVEARMDAGRRVWLWERLYRRDCTDAELLEACGRLLESGVTQFICDPSGKDRIEWLRRNGLPARKARSNDIDMRVAAWTTRLSRDGVFITPGSPNLQREVMGLAWAERRGRELETDRFDPNTPDHAVDAGSYVLGEIESAVPLGMRGPELVVAL